MDVFERSAIDAMLHLSRPALTSPALSPHSPPSSTLSSLTAPSPPTASSTNFNIPPPMPSQPVTQLHPPPTQHSTQHSRIPVSHLLSSDSPRLPQKPVVCPLTEAITPPYTPPSIPPAPPVQSRLETLTHAAPTPPLSCPDACGKLPNMRVTQCHLPRNPQPLQRQLPCHQQGSPQRPNFILNSSLYQPPLPLSTPMTARLPLQPLSTDLSFRSVNTSACSSLNTSSVSSCLAVTVTSPVARKAPALHQKLHQLSSSLSVPTATRQPRAFNLDIATPNGATSTPIPGRTVIGQHLGVRAPPTSSAVHRKTLKRPYKKYYSNPTPSSHCHVCARTSKAVRFAVCARIRDGLCRKVVCYKCFVKFGWDWQTAVDDPNWVCVHCRGECPEGRSQCFIYARVNGKRESKRGKSRTSNADTAIRTAVTVPGCMNARLADMDLLRGRSAEPGSSIDSTGLSS